MGKCVVCSKSAGPFHQLHKKCLSTYQGTRTCLHDKFMSCLESSKVNPEAIDNIRSCKTTEKFSNAQFKNLVIEAWQKQAKLVVKKSTLDIPSAKTLVSIAESFDIHNEDVDEYLLVRLSNTEHLERLQNQQAIDKKFDHLPEGIELEQNETIVWEFHDISKAEQQRYSQEKESTVFNTVMNNAFFKKRYKDLAVRTEREGLLLISNQGLYYKNKQVVSHTKFSEIYSTTPMKNGVRIQSTQRDAVPDTYITGDGRFTYALLQYAQGLTS